MWIPFPAPVSVWQERGPEYSQLDVVITAVPFRSYRTLLVQAQLLSWLGLCCSTWGESTAQIQLFWGGEQCRQLPSDKAHGVRRPHSASCHSFSLVLYSGCDPVRLVHRKCSYILSDRLPAPFPLFCGIRAGSPSGRPGLDTEVSVPSSVVLRR